MGNGAAGVYSARTRAGIENIISDALATLMTALIDKTPRWLGVAWTNHDDIPHTVDDDDHIFASSVLDTNQKFQYAFKDPGKLPYYCRLHPKMTGTVVVE